MKKYESKMVHETENARFAVSLSLPLAVISELGCAHREHSCAHRAHCALCALRAHTGRATPFDHNCIFECFSC